MNPAHIVQPEGVYGSDLDGAADLHEALRQVVCPDTEPGAPDGSHTADELVLAVAQQGWRKVHPPTPEVGP